MHRPQVARKARLTKRQRRLVRKAEASPFCWAVREYARGCNHGMNAGGGGAIETAYTTAADLLETIERLKPAGAHYPDWPATPQQVGVLLSRHAEGLALKGVEIWYRRTGQDGRQLFIEASEPGAQSET